MADPKEMAMAFLKAHSGAPEEPTEASEPEPDEMRHEGDQIMREHIDAVHKNDHQGAHDAMAAMIDHHMAKKMLKK